MRVPAGEEHLPLVLRARHGRSHLSHMRAEDFMMSFRTTSLACSRILPPFAFLARGGSH